MPPPRKPKKKTPSASRIPAQTRTQEVYRAIQEAFDSYGEENKQPPSIYRLALDSGQSRYFCRLFLEKTFRNPQQANDNRRRKSQFKLHKAYEAYMRKHNKQPSVRALASLAKTSLRSAQSYLKALPANLPNAGPKKQLKKDATLTGKDKVLPANLPKHQSASSSVPFLPFGKLTKARKIKLEDGYRRYMAKRRVTQLCRADVGRIASLSGVDFWIALYYFRQQGLFSE